jgi:hypothetical protein
MSDAEIVVQEQVEAYNARDAERFGTAMQTMRGFWGPVEAS